MQSVGEARALHQPATRRGQVELVAEHRHSVSVGVLFAPRISQWLGLPIRRFVIDGGVFRQPARGAVRR
jgi:hypothetical protein